jgi:hypothetical protein
MLRAYPSVAEHLGVATGVHHQLLGVRSDIAVRRVLTE